MPRYIDQPSGTGFSYPVSGTDVGEAGVARDMYDFLQHFFQVLLSTSEYSPTLLPGAAEY